ncbi:MAG: hypothetical protein K0S32_3024 [Bacteroidetes bacterium]|jgi:hypothetical protein|nr:hypothetical protein [Bacteroidota bacterium]
MKKSTLNRKQFPIKLAQKYSEDYEKIMLHYSQEQQIELTEHLLEALKNIQLYYETGENKYWEAYAQNEKTLLKNYRNSLRPYKDANFDMYYEFLIILIKKNLLSEEEFNNLSSYEDQTFSTSEKQRFFWFCNNFLNNRLESLYLQPISSKQTESNLIGSHDKEPEKIWLLNKKFISESFLKLEETGRQKEVFKNSQDKLLFEDALANHFIGKEHNVQISIRTYRNTSTKLANTLRDIYKECSETPLKDDKKFTLLCSKIDVFSKLTHKELVRKMQR